MAESTEPKKSQTYPAGCHCGYIKFDVTLRPPLDEQKVNNCNCSMCRRGGYLLVYPDRDDVKWHGDARERCGVYQFNTKLKDQLFCPKCGCSLGLDFRDVEMPKWTGYGISIRTFDNIDLDKVNIHKSNGLTRVEPAGDLSGQSYEENKAKTE